MICSIELMDRLAAAELIPVIMTAPAWARVALTTRSEEMRQKGAAALSEAIVDSLTSTEVHCDQLTLPL